MAADPDAEWEAGETSVTRSFTLEQAGVLAKNSQSSRGCPAPGSPQDAPKRVSRELPASFKWTDKDGKNWMTQVKDQKGLGICTTYADISVMEAMWNIQNNTTDSMLDLSEWYMWQFNKNKQGNVMPYGGDETNEGWPIDPSLKNLQDNGTVAENLCPTPLSVTPVPAYNAPPEGSVIYKITGYNILETPGSDLTKLKEALLQGPLVTDMTVWEDFFMHKKQKSLETPYVHVSAIRIKLNDGTYRAQQDKGFHTIALVGWIDRINPKTKKSETLLICRNSWGPEWGSDGYWTISTEQTASCVRWYKAYSISGITTMAITSVTPNSFSQNTATALSIAGTGFGTTQGTGTVKIGTTQANATALTGVTWGATSITGTTPALAAGIYYVYVTVNGATATSTAITVGSTAEANWNGTWKYDDTTGWSRTMIITQSEKVLSGTFVDMKTWADGSIHQDEIGTLEGSTFTDPEGIGFANITLKGFSDGTNRANQYKMKVDGTSFTTSLASSALYIRQ
ncbi:MAG: C1 family peptidase [Vulcanimicrobiota bacterium]